MEEMSFKGFFLFFFSRFTSGDPFVQQRRNILAILVKVRKKNISVKLFKSCHWPRRCRFKVFLLLLLLGLVIPF